MGSGIFSDLFDPLLPGRHLFARGRPNAVEFIPEYPARFADLQPFLNTAREQIHRR
jgi:hypothetical protein